MRLVTFLTLFILIGFFLTCPGGGANQSGGAEEVYEIPAVHEPLQSASVGQPSPDPPARRKQSALADNILQRKIEIMKLLGGGALTKGNRAALLLDDYATYAAMFSAIQNARDHINLETFSIVDDERGRRFSDLLIEKQAEGVQVNLMYDSAGSFHAPASFFERLRKGGVRVLEFNPLNPFKARGTWRPVRRDHRKILIVDGTLAITGGINISEVYSTGLFPSKKKLQEARIRWRDTNVWVEGPAVAEFQKNFLNEWKRQHGSALSGRNYFPSLRESGDDLVGVLGSYPGRMSEVMYRMYLSVIESAEKSAHLTNAYFTPDDRMQKALINAAARGVDVRLILPAFSDVPEVFHAERYYYSELLKSGVKLYERRKKMLHAKTAVVDGVWSTVGSTNIDYWSFFYNNEENAVILSRRFANDMEEMFAGDLRESNEIRLAEWEKRPWSDRVKEWCAHLLAHWL